MVGASAVPTHREVGIGVHESAGVHSVGDDVRGLDVEVLADGRRGGRRHRDARVELFVAGLDPRLAEPHDARVVVGGVKGRDGWSNARPHRDQGKRCRARLVEVHHVELALAQPQPHARGGYQAKGDPRRGSVEANRHRAAR